MNDNIQKIIDLMERDDSVEAPVDSTKWAKDLFRTRVFEPRSSVLRQIVAALKMEIAPGTAIFGERSGSSAADRELFFTADEIGIQIRIRKVKRSHLLRGQIMSDSVAGFSAIARFGSSVVTSEIDSGGSFSFDNVPSGELTISIASSEFDITIPALEIG